MSRRFKSEASHDASSPANSLAGGGEQPASKQPSDWWKSLIICLLLALSVWIVFGQTVRYEFVNYDDDSVVYENPVVTRGLDSHEIVWTFTHESGRDSWFPVTDISHMLDWQMYGPNAGGHHLTNVLLHAAAAIVLFLALQKMTGAIWRSGFVAALFAIHPLRVESVAWVAERKDVLSGLFFMLALWTWARYAQGRAAIENRQQDAEKTISALTPRRWTLDYYLALLFFVLGMLSKSMLVTLPFVLLLLDYWPLNRALQPGSRRPFFLIWLDLILEKWPFFLLSAAGGMATLLTQRHVVLAARHLTVPWRIGNALLAYVDYLGHMIYPVGLRLLYPHPESHLALWRVCFSLMVLLIISAGVFIGRRKCPCLVVGWLWYLGMFVPVIDIMQTGDQARADRYTYLPQIGLCLMIAWGATEFFRSWPFRRLLLGSVAVIILTALSATAYVQTTHWKNSVSLWTRTLACWPQSYIAHCNLGIALADQGNVNEAVQHFNQALEINPDDAKSINNLAKVLTSEGKTDEAIRDFHYALQLDPDDAKTLSNLGVALAARGKLDEAIQDINRALQLKPEYAEAYYNLGNLLASRNDLDGAAQNYKQALEINPHFPEANCNLGLILARQGNLDEAALDYERAIELKPHYRDALNNLGGLLAAQGKLDEAAQYYKQVLQLAPDDPNVLNNLGVTLARQGKLDEAVQYFNQALQINPNDPSSHNNLGLTLANQGKRDEAIQHFQKALYLARAQNNFTLEESIRARLKLYQPDSPSAP